MPPELGLCSPFVRYSLGFSSLAVRLGLVRVRVRVLRPVLGSVRVAVRVGIGSARD